MSEWIATTLGNLCEFKAGGAFPKKYQGQAEGTFPFVKVSDMTLAQNSRSLVAANHWVSADIADELRARPVQPGSTVFAKIGEGLRSERLRRIIRPTLIDNNMMAAFPKGGTDADFLYYFLHVVGLSDVAEGSALPYLRAGDLANVPVVAPSRDEQRRIASVLGAFDDLIETNRDLASRAAHLARSIAATVSTYVPLSNIATASVSKQIRPEGQVSHYSLPAFDEDQVPEQVDGESIKSNKLPVTSPTVLVSRLNPKWERCWMVYPGENAVSSTEFVPFVGYEVATEEVWAVASASHFWDQMRSRVTGTTGSHQRVSKDAIATLVIPDVRLLADDKRRQIIDLVRTVQAHRDEIADLTRTRDELLPLLMSGKVRVEDVEIPKEAA